jgi:WD40 repeat protein
MQSAVLGIVRVLTLVLVVCVFLGFSKQSMQQAPPPVAQFGMAQRRVISVPIPPGARPPDKVLQGARVSSGIITASAFSPDGKWLAWCGYDNAVTIWNVATGAEVRSLAWARPVSTPATKLAFSPDGKHLAIIAGDEVNVWDLQSDRTVYSLKVGAELFAYSSDGKEWAASVAGARDDLTARIEIRDAATGQTVRTIATNWYGVSGMAMTRDGMLVVSGTTHQDIGEEENPRGTVQVWEIASGKAVKSSAEFPVVGQVSPDGRLMANLASGAPGQAGIVITDLATGQVKWTLKGEPGPLFFSFSPDSQELAAASDNASERGLTVWSLVTGAKISYTHDVPNENDPRGLTTVAFSPDGKSVVAAPYPDFSAKIWDVASGRELQEFAGQFTVQALAMSPDGKALVSSSPAVTVQDPATGMTMKTLTIEDADMLTFSADGRWLAANPGVFPGGIGRSLEVWDTRTWTPVANLTPPRDPHSNLPVTWFALGASAAPLQSKLGNAQAMQFTGDRQTQTVWFSDSPMAVSPDGKLLVELGSPTNHVDVWDAVSGQKMQSFEGHKVSVLYQAFSKDGRSLVTIGQDSMPKWVAGAFQGNNEYGVKVWDVATWKERMWISYPLIRPFSALLSPDGQRLAIERSRQLVEMVDANNGKSLGAFAATVTGTDAGWNMGKPNLAFSPDGTLLLQGAKNGIRVWKLAHP